MNTLLKHFPEIIKESASSPLGIVALIVLLIAVLAFFFFKTAPIKIRFAAFSMMAIMFFVIALIAISEKTQEFKNLHQDPPYAGPQAQPVQPQTQPPQTPQADSAENQLKRELNDRLAYAHALISSVADQVEKVTTAPPSEMDREKNSLQQVSQQFVTFFPGVWNGY